LPPPIHKLLLIAPSLTTLAALTTYYQYIATAVGGTLHWRIGARGAVDWYDYDAIRRFARRTAGHLADDEAVVVAADHHALFIDSWSVRAPTHVCA